MKTDGKFDYRIVEIQAKYNKPINIFFHGDEHFNSPSFARRKWEADLEMMKEISKRETAYFIKTGDVFEALSTSERHIFSNSGFHESNKSRWESEYAKEIKDYSKQVGFMKGRTLAVFGGNHFFSFYDGTTSDMALASELNAPYIGCSGYVVLILRIDEHHSHAVRIFVHHGRSSGRTAGSTFSSLEQAAAYFSDADILVMGHDHKAGAMRLPAISLDYGHGNWKVNDRQRIIGRAGSYLKAYEPGKSSYAVDAMMRPSTLGCLRVVITPKFYRPTYVNGKRPAGEFTLDINAVI